MFSRLGDRGAGGPVHVTIPLYGTLHPPNVASNVLGHGPSRVRRDEPFGPSSFPSLGETEQRRLGIQRMVVGL